LHCDFHDWEGSSHALQAGEQATGNFILTSWLMDGGSEMPVTSTEAATFALQPTGSIAPAVV
jgi:hypothetical protein